MQCSLRVLVRVCLVLFTWAAVADASAAAQKAKEPSPVVAAKPAKHKPEQGQSPVILRAKKSLVPPATERQPEVIQELTKPVPPEVKGKSPKSHRRLKVHRKRVPKAIVQPRTDMMHHGMLESPQRYELRWNHLGTGLQSPHAPELAHDHFQELDRNQDGLIDPIERAFSRLDIDRDLQNHRLR